MSNSLEGLRALSTFPRLLQIADANGLDGTLRVVRDGAGDPSALSLSTLGASITGDLTVNGTASIPYVPLGAGAVTRTVQDRLRELGVVDADYTTETDRAAAAMARTVTERALRRRYLGPDGAEQFRISAFPGDNGGATEYVEIMGGPAHTGPTISFWSDTDANCDGNVVAKGAGGVYFGNASGVLFACVDNGLTTNSNAYLTLTNAQRGLPPVMQPAGSEADITAWMAPKGNRGVLLGRGGSAGGFGSVAFGNFSSANGFYSVAAGNQATDRSAGSKRVYSAGFFGAAAATSQDTMHQFYRTSTGAATVDLTSNNASLSSNNAVPLPNNFAFAGIAVVLMRDTVTLDSAMWWGPVAWSRGASAATTAVEAGGAGLTLVYAKGTLASLTGASARAAADTSLGTGLIRVTGAGSNAIRTNAMIWNLEGGNG